MAASTTWRCEPGNMRPSGCPGDRSAVRTVGAPPDGGVQRAFIGGAGRPNALGTIATSGTRDPE